MQSPAGGLCGVPYHALNCASTACRYNSVGLNYIPYTKMCDVTKHRTGAKYRSGVLVKRVWCGAYYWFWLPKGTGYGFYIFL